MDHITHIFVEMSFSLRFANIYIFFFVHFILSLGTPRLLIVNEPRYTELLLAYFSIMHNLINIQGIFPDFKLISFFLPPTQNKRNNKNDTYVYICTLRFSFDFIMVWGTCLKHISLLFSDINKYLFFYFINVL